MAAEVGQQKNEPLPGDTCDVTQIQDEDLLRKMWQTTEDFGRKKEIRARMYKLREQRLREFYTTGEVLKDVQSVDPAAVTMSTTTTSSSSTSIREETPKRCGTHYRQLVVGELRGNGGDNLSYEETSSSTNNSSSSSSSMQVHRSEQRTNGGIIEITETRTSRLPRLNVSRTSEVTTEQSTQQTERQISNTDTKIMSELQKLDTFLSTTGVDTPTPTPEKIGIHDTTNWTVVSATNNEINKDITLNNARVEEFVFESGEGDEPRTKTVIAEYHAPGSDKSPEVHAVVRQSETKWSGETTDGTTVTRTSTSSSSYSMQTQQKRISTDLSKDHEAFARSLRSSPERRMYDSSTSTRSSSKNSLDASVGRRSPERPFSTRSPTRSPRPADQQTSPSPRASPDKEQRGSPTRLNRISPTRASPDKNRTSPSRDVVDKSNHMRPNPDKITTRPSPERQIPATRTSPVREVRKTSQTSSTREVSVRRTSQTSPTREIPVRRTSQTSPTREVTRPASTSSPRESPTRRTSQTSPVRESPARRTSQTSPSRESPTRSQPTQARASPDKERASSPEKSSSPTRVSSTTTATTRVSSTTTKERRKLSSASTRSTTKRLGTPGASPTTSPTRDSKRDHPKDSSSSDEDDNQPEERLDDQKPPTEILTMSDFETDSKKSTTLSTSTLSTTLKTNSMSEISNKQIIEKDIGISATGTLPRKKSNLKQPSIQSAPQTTTNSLTEISSTEKKITSSTRTQPRGDSPIKEPSTPQHNKSTKEPSTPQSSQPVTSDSSPELTKPCLASQITTTIDKIDYLSKLDIKDDESLTQKKISALKEPVTPQTTPQSSPSPDSFPDKPSKFTSTLRESPPEQKKAPASPVDKPRSILRRDESPKASQIPVKPSSIVESKHIENKPTPVESKPTPIESKPIPSEPDDHSSRSLPNGTPESPNKTSEFELLMENAPCEPTTEHKIVKKADPGPMPIKKSPSHDRPGRRRSRDYVSDEDTSGRESSSSPVRKQPTRQQPSKAPQKSKIPAASPQRPTKLPVASSKLPEAVPSPDRCCGRAHDSDKPWRQSPASTPVSSPKKKSPASPASPVISPERKPITSTPIRRRPASRSPSTSPDRPHEPQTRPGRKSPPQKTAQSPRSPPAKQTASSSPWRKSEPESKRSTTERTSSASRPRGIPEPQRPTGLAKPQTRGPTSPTKLESPIGRKKPESPKHRGPADDDRPPQEFHADETSEDDTCVRRQTTSRIATSTARRADVVRNVQATQQVVSRTTTRQPQPVQSLKSPASRVPRAEPQRPTSVGRVPVASQKRPAETTKPRPVRTDSDRSIGSVKKSPLTPTKQPVASKTTVKPEVQKTSVAKKQVTQVSTRTTTTTSRLQSPRVTVTKKTTPTSKVPVSKPVENGRAPVESEDEESCMFSTEEDETVTELEEVRYSSHTVDTEDEDFKARVNARGASLKPATTDIIQLRSSRESSPEAQRRYADRISEPDTDTDMHRQREVTPLNIVVKSEQVTDLDETDEPDPSELSVADRVSRFLTPTATTVSPPEKKKPVIIETVSPSLDSPSAVRRARAMFETIANSPPSEPTPRQTVPDILNRPSVFESPNRGRVSPAVPAPVRKPFVDVVPTDEHDESEPETKESKETSVDDDKFKTITKVKKLDEDRFNTITKDTKKVDESRFNTITKQTIRTTDESDTIVKETAKTINDDSKYRTITKEKSVEREPIKPIVDRETPSPTKDVESTFVSTATLRSKQEVTKRNDSEQNVTTTTRRDSERKVTSRRDSDNKVTTRRDSDKITTRRDSDNKITTRRDSGPITRRDSGPITRRDSENMIIEKPRATVTPRQESPGRTTDVASKRPEPSKQPAGGKFGVTLRQTSKARIDTAATTGRQVTEQKKTSTTTTTVVESIVIEQITDLKVLEHMLEKATDYDERRRLRAQIREVRRLGPAHFTPTQPASKEKEPRKPSPTRQTPAAEEPSRRPSSSSSPTRRPSDTTRQSPTRVPDTSRQSPTRVPDTSRQSPTRVPDTSRQSPTRVTDSPRQSPTRVIESPRQSPSRVPDTSRQSPVRQSPERRISSTTKEPDSRGSSPCKEPARKSSSTSPRDEEDGNRMSSTVRQASKKFEQNVQTREESKFATFTRQSSSKKVQVDEVKQEDTTNKFSTFTRSSSNKKLPEPSKEATPPPTERKSSKSELTIELSKPSTTPADGNRPRSTSNSTTTVTRKPSVPANSAPREVNPTDSITSSYGVGPTDESGRPLFGLRALRRSQQQEPGSVVIDQQRPTPVADTPDSTEVRDSSGRPLFGLRAIKRDSSPRSGEPSPARGGSPAVPCNDKPEEPKPHVMPERAPSSGQLRDLVQRHEQRTSNVSATNPAQKPRAKLRDSFITQEIRGSVTRTSKEEALTSRNADRTNALRAIIQKHETITDCEQNKLARKDSSRIETKQTSYTVHENGVTERSSPAPRTEREESPKPTVAAVEPVRRPSTEGSVPEQTRRPGILKKPRDSPERSSTTTTTSSTAVSTATINLRKVDEASVNKIIEETRRSSITRSPPDGSTSNTFELESPRAVAEITQRALHDKSQDYDEEQVITDEDGGETRVRRTHKEEKDDTGSRSFTRTAAVSKRSEPGREERSYTAVTTVTQQKSTIGTTPPSPGKPEHSIARVGRSGSVKALQQRFQQAAAGPVDTPVSNKFRGAGYQKAGLIFRTNSFQHTNGCGPEHAAGNRSKEGSPSPSGRRDSEIEVEEQQRQSSTARSGSSTVTVSKSFLGNENRVTGVQDILTRMREADHEEVAPGTSEDDREARALLNKFLGAQVLLQGMEPLVAAQSPALVSQVERQRIVTSTTTSSVKGDIKSSAEEDELERIWDEKRLRQLLEASDDYDSRRKIRARLRVVMAENKVTAPTGSETQRDSSEQSTSSSSSAIATSGDGAGGVLSTVREHSESSVVNSSASESTIRTEVHTKTSSFSSSMTSQTRVSKATPPSKLQMSPFAKFKQLDEQNSSPSPSSPKTPGGSSSVPLFKFTDAALSRSASTVKDKLLYWCQIKTKEYKDLKIENFSTSWSNGLAFCALIHHFCPDAFDYSALRPECRRKNFELAFRVAEEKFDIAPLLDVDDMVMMKKPDWKCVFTYVQSIYRRFKDELD